MKHKICDTFGRITKAETQARKSMKSSIRLASIGDTYGDELAARLEWFDDHANDQTLISELYALLSDEQKDNLRRGYDNPVVTYSVRDNDTGETIDILHVGELDVLVRLEAGHEVGSIVQTQLVRKPGDKAF